MFGLWTTKYFIISKKVMEAFGMIKPVNNFVSEHEESKKVE